MPDVDANGTIRRLDVNAIRPYEYTFFDLKELPPGQLHGYQYVAVLVDYKSLKIDTMLLKSKTETGFAVRKMLSDNGVNTLPYQTTCHFDGDRSNNVISDTVWRLGVRAEPVTPYRQSFNLCELAIRLLNDAAKKLCYEARMHPCYLGLAYCAAAVNHTYISARARDNTRPCDASRGHSGK